MRMLIGCGAVLALGLIVWLRPARPVAVAAVDWATAAPAVRAPARASAAPAVVYVAGEVVHPGVYSVGPGERVAAAVTLAGGMSASADTSAVNLAAHVRDGDEILVPARGAVAPHRPGRRRTAGPRRRASSRRGTGAPAAATVDLNSADAATLASVPGIGPGFAERIVAFRATNGSFDSTDELLDVAGMTDRRLAMLLPYVVVR